MIVLLMDINLFSSPIDNWLFQNITHPIPFILKKAYQFSYQIIFLKKFMGFRHLEWHIDFSRT